MRDLPAALLCLIPHLHRFLKHDTAEERFIHAFAHVWYQA